MTSRVFGLRAAQFSGLFFQPSPARRAHRHRSPPLPASNGLTSGSARDGAARVESQPDRGVTDPVANIGLRTTDADINQLCEKYSPQARAGVTGQLRSKREWQLRDMGSLPPLWDRPRVLDYDDERAQLLRWI